MQENTDQKKLRIWTPFAQCISNNKRKQQPRCYPSISITDFDETLIIHRENQREFYQGENGFARDHIDYDFDF